MSDARAKDGLSVVGQSPEEAYNCPSALRIQPRSRFVQEQEKLRFGSKLDGNGQPLPVFDAQRADNSVCTLLQAAHQETFLSICHLLCLRNVPGLTKNCREKDCLADRRSWLVCVHLLTVSRLTLEVHREGSTVHEPITSDDTDVRTLCEYIQQCGLFLCGQFDLIHG